MIELMAVYVHAYANDNQSLRVQQNKAAEQIQNAVFNQTKLEEFPITNNQIKDIRLSKEASDKATYGPIHRVKQTQRTVNLDISSPSIQKINLVPNFASIVSFFDASGSPWMIDKAFASDNTGVTVNIIGEKSNQLVLTTQNTYQQGTLIVTLKGLDNAISLNFNANDHLSDRRVSYTLTQLSPKSLPSKASNSGYNRDQSLLLDLLAGSVPPNAQPMKIDGKIRGQAWRIGNKLYIRTQDQLISPAWSAQKSASGVTVFQLSAGDTQFLFSSNQSTQEVSIIPQDIAKGRIKE